MDFLCTKYIYRRDSRLLLERNTHPSHLSSFRFLLPVLYHHAQELEPSLSRSRIGAQGFLGARSFILVKSSNVDFGLFLNQNYAQNLAFVVWFTSSKNGGWKRKERGN